MKSLISIINRNFKVIIRSKVSTFLVFLAPILIVFLVGTAFSSNSLHNLKVGVYSNSYNDLTNSIIYNLEAKQFVSERLNSQDDCINAVKDAEVHVCIIFPPDLSVTGNSDSIVVYTDNSRINIAYILINEINSIISVKGSELGVVMAQSLLDTIQNAKTSLPNQKSGVSSAINGVDNISFQEKSVSDNFDSLQTSINDLNTNVNKVVKELNGSQNAASLKKEITDIQAELQNISSNIHSQLDNIDFSSKETKDELNKVSGELDLLLGRVSAIKIQNAQDVVLPIRTEVRPITNDETNWKYLFPTLVALITLLSSIVLSSSMVLAERKARAHFRNFMTPTSDVSFILGTYITCLMIIVLQLLILFLGTVYLTSINVHQALGQISIILLLSASSFIFLGMLIGYAFKSDETTVLASISISSLLIFFSNAILPTEIINGGLKYLAVYNPFYVTDVLLRKAILFNSSIYALAGQMLILLGSLVVFFILTLIFRKMTKRLL